MKLGMTRAQIIDFSHRLEIKLDNDPESHIPKLADGVVQIARQAAIDAAVSLIEENNRILSAQIEKLLPDQF